MFTKIRIVVFTGLFLLVVLLFSNQPILAYDNPSLLPDYPTPVIDLAKSLSTNQRSELEQLLVKYEEDTGWKIRVLTQFEQTPGLAIKEFWDIDESSLIVIADPRRGNLLNFNVGDAYYSLMPRLFWVELQSRYGNQFYVRDNGEDLAILNSIQAVKTCLDKGGCEIVPGLPREQWVWTLTTSILGGLIAGIAAYPRTDSGIIAWKWLLLISPLWIILFGVFGIAPVVTRTSDLIPLLRNIMSFLGSSIASYLFASYSIGRAHKTDI